MKPCPFKAPFMQPVLAQRPGLFLSLWNPVTPALYLAGGAESLTAVKSPSSDISATDEDPRDL